MLMKIPDLNYKTPMVILVFVMSLLVAPVIAQNNQQEVKIDKPARDAFESAWWFDGQTGKVYDKNTLEFTMQHRFANINKGFTDLFGIYGPTNVRLGFSYAPINKLNVGFGYTKNKKILDFNAKYAILAQTRSNSMPLSLAYYANVGVELMDKENYLNSSDRFNYFHQLIITRRFDKNISAQLSPSFTHRNRVDFVEQQDASIKKMENDTWGLSAGVRFKITPGMIIIMGYDLPITQHDIAQPEPSFNFGIEIVTSSHAFQIFATNNNRILPQENFTFNQNDYAHSEYLIGFNITRLWSF